MVNSNTVTIKVNAPSSASIAITGLTSYSSGTAFPTPGYYLKSSQNCAIIGSGFKPLYGVQISIIAIDQANNVSVPQNVMTLTAAADGTIAAPLLGNTLYNILLANAPYPFMVLHLQGKDGAGNTATTILYYYEG